MDGKGDRRRKMHKDRLAGYQFLSRDNRGRRVGRGGAQIGSCRLEGCRPIPPGGRRGAEAAGMSRAAS